jgi:hypothetical protein
MLFDKRENLSSVIENAIAVTTGGNALEIQENRQHFIDIHLKKHPYLIEFIQNPKCGLDGRTIEKFYVIQEVQKTTILDGKK